MPFGARERYKATLADLTSAKGAYKVIHKLKLVDLPATLATMRASIAAKADCAGSTARVAVCGEH